MSLLPLLLPAALAADLAILHATVLPVSGDPIPDGTVVVRDGKIVSVGTGPAPAGAQVVDAAGGWLMPGIIDAHSHMGVYPWPGANAHDDGNEAVEAFTPRAWAGDAFDVEDPALARARAGGVTTIMVLPGSANLIGGQAATLKLRPSITLDGMRFDGAPRGIKMALGENPKRVYGGVTDDDQIKTRMGLFAAMRAEFQAALDYAEARKRKEPPPKDLDLEVLLDVLSGEVRVHVHCYRSFDILGLFRLADELGFTVASLHHALDAYKVRDVIAAHGTAVATFTDWWGFKMEAWDAIPQNAPLLASAGVVTAIKSDSASHVQRLNLEAAKLVRYGMSERDALATVTLNPAKILGVDARVGTIEVGKDADLALFDHHPFDVYGKCVKTWIDGELVYDRAVEGTPSGVR